MKIRAAVLHQMGAPAPYAHSRPLQIETLDLEPPGEGELLVEIRAAGLCHSDLSVVDGARPRPMPIALGHEASGIVLEIGPSVHDIAAGDHVVLVFVPSCGHCIPCAQGRPALCEPGAAANAGGSLSSGAVRLSLAGRPVHHHLGISAFADHVVVSRNSVVRIDPELPFEVAALFGCAVITGVGAVFNTAQVRAGSTVAVVGLGGVGLNSVLGAQVAGARTVIAIDLREEKLALARHLGATNTFNATTADCAAQVRDFTAGGVDYAFEMAGSTAALGLAWAITKRGGQTVTAGLAPPEGRLSLPPFQLVGEERTLKGSYLGSSVPVRDIPAYIALYRAGRLPVDRLLSQRIGLADLNEALDRLASGETARQLIVF